MHSSQSMPDIVLEERQHTGTLPSFQNYIHTQSPPLIYPSSTTASHHNKSISAFLSASASTPTTTTASRGQHHYPTLFSQNHSFADETVRKYSLIQTILLANLFLVVQNLLNSMSINQPAK